jgi:diguanylate cyclase (GGDEF)-like protein
MDRRLLVSLLAAFAALTCGVLAVILDAPLLGVAAGIAGVGGGIAAAAIAARAKANEQALADVVGDRQRLRRELDALAAIFAEEATRRSAAYTATEPDVRTPGREPVFDPVSGLLDEQFFSVIVHQRVAAARRQLQPVSVVIFEIDGFNGLGDDTRDQALGVLGAVVQRTLRECDTACRVGETMAAAVLEDTAESGAVWAAERVRGTLHGSPVGDSLTISAGIACYPSHALSGPELMDMASRALGTARSQGRDHVEIAQAE